MTLDDGERKAVVALRLDNAVQALDDAVFLAERNSFRAAVNRCYYAVFYATSALLVNQGKVFRKHSGLIACFHAEFIKTGVLERELGRILQTAFDNRSEADYQDIVRFKKDDVQAAVSEARRFVTEIAEFLKKQQP